MKNKLIASAILVVCGVVFLLVANPLAVRAHDAPAGGYNGSIIEFAYGLPAFTFTLVGTLAIVAGVGYAAITLCVPVQPKE